MKRLKIMSILVAFKAYLSAKFDKAQSCGFAKMIKNADAKTLGEISFEIDKRAAKLRVEAEASKQDFKSEFDKKIASISQDEQVKFKEKFIASYNEKVLNLSVKEANELALKPIEI
ncbi:DUF1104 domain-containing protein [Campylobacter sp. RM16192]|uniref:DUF1104 domain-containing protein n=1 Tax=Campylobacter sp. RM16192 TaxID=1660080 RepID=UPI00145198B9|nr:DUF1104 domain-containing protein [Campylobacter sp. RM16192]QCD52754.1 putative protein (DUF1104 domain) [Campylobacter sp. RM16192]